MNALTYVHFDSCTLREKKQQMFENLLYHSKYDHLLTAIMPRKYIEGRFLQITCGMHTHYREMETLRNS